MTTHHAYALLITCMDYRFVDSFFKEAHDIGIQHSYDRIALAGDIKSLVKPAKPQDAEFMMRQIEISAELHSINEVVIIAHQNCGAYPELKDVDESTEVNRHYEDLRAAKKLIEAKYSKIKVVMYFATLKGGDHENIIGFDRVD